MLAEAFLPDFWADALALLGAVGVFLTAIGVWLAWWQTSRTTAANTAATNAAVGATLEAKSAYQRQALNRISRLLGEAISRVETKEWSLAAMRARDVADSLQELGVDTKEWQMLVANMHSMERSLSRVGSGEIHFKGIATKWFKLQQSVRTAIAAESFPFPDARA